MALFNKSSGNTFAEIAISDTHTGEKKALMYPDPALDYRPNSWQRWLFKHFTLFQEEADRIISKWKADYVHVSCLGDMGSMRYKHGGNGDFWAHSEDEVIANTAQLFGPLAKTADAMHWIHGNSAHVGANGKLDNLIARDFADVVVKDPVSDRYVHPAVDLSFQDVLFNYTHKGKNRTKWTTINGLISLSAEVALDRAKKGEKIPDVIGRGHFHFQQHVRDIKPVVVSLGGWKLKDEFVTYIDPVDETPHVGGEVIIVRDGEIVDMHSIKYSPERNRPWTPK